MKAHFIIMVAILLLPVSFARAGEEVLSQEWDAGTQTKGGKAKICYLKNIAVTLGGELITSNLSLFGARQGDNSFETIFTLKVVVVQIEEEEEKIVNGIPIYSAWIKSSTGSTVGQLTELESPGYFFGGVAGGKAIPLFTLILKGLLTDGMTVGFQTLADAFDRVIHIKEPLPTNVAKNFFECLGELKEVLSGQN
jgi:hypothetical protein